MLKIKILLIFILVFVHIIAISSKSLDFNMKLTKKQYLDNAIRAILDGLNSKGADILREANEIYPNTVDIVQLLGSLLSTTGNYLEGSEYLAQAVQLDNYQTPSIAANYIEALRSSGGKNVEKARAVGEQTLKTHPMTYELIFNLAAVYETIGSMHRDSDDAKKRMEELYLQCLGLVPPKIVCWQKLMDMKIESGLYHEADLLADKALESPAFKDPSMRAEILFLKGLNAHNQNNFKLALALYLEATELITIKERPMIWANLAALYHVLGDVNNAVAMYDLVLPHFKDDGMVMNNYGALLGIMGRKEEELVYLNKAHELNPDVIETCINLGSYHQDAGNIPLALELFEKTKRLDPTTATLMTLRQNLILSPVASSWASMLEERERMETKLLELINYSNIYCKAGKVNGLTSDQLREQRNLSAVSNSKSVSNNCTIIQQKLDNALDRVHFYISYHGLNDRYIQDLVVTAYHRVISDVSAFNTALGSGDITSWQNSFVLIGGTEKGNVMGLSTSSASAKATKNPKGRLQIISGNTVETSSPHTTVTTARRVRVGFMSKFFGIFEPHGMLLDGFMRYLPKEMFDVVVLEVARTDGKPLAHSIANVSEVIVLPLNHKAAIELIIGANIDILIFADVMSEPLNHFLAHSRVAPIQMAFWGNPVTSASDSMDYFLSNYWMEHPFRTRMPVQDEPYTEQVVLLEGQGIWYFKPLSVKEELIKSQQYDLSFAESAESPVYRTDYGLQNEWFIYFCPQSSFKIHPLFDDVLLRILEKDENAHVVVTGGRRQSWSDIYTNRLFNGTDRAVSPSVLNRLHVINRISSEKFLQLLRIADVVLHPFPFDGSRTSADAILVGIPYVTLPAEYLRGRMGSAFLRTMNVPELVAQNIDDYVDISYRLLRDKQFYAATKKKLIENSYLIWEDMEVVHSFTNLLLKISGLNPVQWDDFIVTTGRDSKHETRLRDKRRSNQKEFDEAFGQEIWLLESPTESGSMSEEQCRGCRIRFDMDQAPRGVARLETKLSIDPVVYGKEQVPSTRSLPIPRIFNNWKSTAFASASEMDEYLHSVYVDVLHQPHTISGPRVKIVDNNTLMEESGNELFSKSSGGALYGSTSDHFVSSSYVSTPLAPGEYAHIRQTLTQGHTQRGYDMLMAHYSLYSDHPQYLMELGLVEYFRGNYQMSYDYCYKSAKLLTPYLIEHGYIHGLQRHEGLEVGSGVLYSCLGLSGMYLKHDSALDYVLKAWEYGSTTGKGGYDVLYSDIFTLPTEAIDKNLVSAYRTAGKLKSCWNVASKSFTRNRFYGKTSGVDTTPMVRNNTEFNAYVIIFAFVDWFSTSSSSLKSTKHHELLEELGRGLVHMTGTNGGTRYNATSSMFLDEIIRAQQHYSHVLDVSIDCLTEAYPVLVAQIMFQLTNILHNISPYSTASLTRIPTATAPVAPLNSMEGSEKINPSNSNNCEKNEIALVTQYYLSSDPEIMHCMNTTLLKNLYNPCITDIYLLTEHFIDFEAEFPVVLSGSYRVADGVQPTPKLHQHIVGRRLTYGIAIDFSNKYLVGKIIIIANADIYFDATLGNLPLTTHAGMHSWSNTALALTKWIDKGVKGHFRSHMRTDSQDAWIFQSPLQLPDSGTDPVTLEQSQKTFELLDFVLGAARCDNRIAFILANIYNYNVINAAFSVHAIEYDNRNRVDGVYGTEGAIIGEGLNLYIRDDMYTPF